MQAIANTAGFHFAFIEQGGASLYPTLAFKATDPEVLRILVSIGGVEIDHFGLWHDKAGNAVAQPLAGVTDPNWPYVSDLNAFNSELDQTNLILPEPCKFISKNLPQCSVIRPTYERRGRSGDNQGVYGRPLFLGQSSAFLPGEQSSRSKPIRSARGLLSALPVEAGVGTGCVTAPACRSHDSETFDQEAYMFEGLFQPMHLLVIFGLALLVFGPKKLPNLVKDWERAFVVSSQP